MVFLRDQTFFDSRTFFRSDQKQIFFSPLSTQSKLFFEIYFLLDFQHANLSSRGVTTFTLALHLYF